MTIDIKDISGLVFQEHINLENANKILNNWDEVKKSISKNRLNLYEGDYKAYDPLLSLKKQCKNNNPINNVSYNYSKNLKTYGRLFAQSASLQGLPREIRETIATDYIDIDFKNAHPTILLKYCKINNIDCPKLEHYINNRDEVFKNIYDAFKYTRDETKYLILSFLNGGKREGLIDKFLIDFQNEIEKIHEKISIINKDIKKEISRRKTYNINASICNVILCKKENECLLYAVQYLKSIGFNIDVLIFDGFLVRKDDNNILDDEILKKTSLYIESKTGYKLELEIKPFKNILDLSKLKNIVSDNDFKETYYKDKAKFEENHIKISYPPMFITTFNNRPCILQSQEDFIKSNLELKTFIKVELNGKEKIEKTSFIKTWINDENLRKKESLTFKPPPIVEDNYEYNTWRDFEIKKIKLLDDFNINDNEPIKRFIDYIDNLLGNRTVYTNYLIALIANIIQNPGNRACVCIVLYSIVEGVGKSLLNDLINKLLGVEYCYDCTDIQNGLFGKHSMAEFQKLYISLVELKGKDTYLNNEVFKSRITDTRREYEPKGLKSFHAPNYATYLCTTNNYNCLPVNDKSRRFFIATCNNKNAEDKLYFKKFNDEIINDNYNVRCIFEYLSKFDIEAVVPNKLFQEYIPKDDPLYFDLVEYNKEIEWGFLEYFIRDTINNDKKITEYKISTKDLWHHFDLFISNNGENKKSDVITSRKFHFTFKQKIVQVLQNKAEYKDAIKYSTRDNRIRNNKDEECYLFNISDLKKYFNITRPEFIED